MVARIEDQELKGFINVPNVKPELEKEFLQFTKRFHLGKAEAARLLISDGLSHLGKKDEIVLKAGA